MPPKNSHLIPGYLVGIYLIFSTFYLLFLLFSPVVPNTPIFLLLILTLPSLFIFFTDMNKGRESFYRDFLILISIIYLLELPSFVPNVDSSWGFFLIDPPDYLVWFSFLVIILAIPSANKKSLPPQRKTLSKVLYPSVSEENGMALRISMLFFAFLFILYIFSFSAPYTNKFFHGIIAGLQILLYTLLAFFLVRTYLRDGLPYAILLASGYVMTLMYFGFSGIYKISFIETLWVLPFAIAGIFYLVSGFLSRARNEGHRPMDALH